VYLNRTREGIKILLKSTNQTKVEDALQDIQISLPWNGNILNYAIHLLKAGEDFATITQWLGHASP
jgi:site-specific recombinase XerD